MDPTVFVHPQGLCESDAIGARTRVWAFAHVLAGAVIGADCNVCDHAYVEAGVTVGDRVTIKNGVMLFEGVTIEDDVFLGPGATFTNDLNPRATVRKSHDQLVPTIVRKGATVGAAGTVVCGVTIGAGAFVAAGAVVTRDVPPYALVAGNPARRLRWICACGLRLTDDGAVDGAAAWAGPRLRCSCGRSYRLRSEDEGLELIL